MLDGCFSNGLHNIPTIDQYDLAKMLIICYCNEAHLHNLFNDVNLDNFFVQKKVTCTSSMVLERTIISFYKELIWLVKLY